MRGSTTSPWRSRSIATCSSCGSFSRRRGSSDDSRGRGRGGKERETDGSDVHDRRALGRGAAPLEDDGAGGGRRAGAGRAGDRPHAERIPRPGAGDGGAVHATPGSGGPGGERPQPRAEGEVGARGRLL